MIVQVCSQCVERVEAFKEVANTELDTVHLLDRMHRFDQYERVSAHFEKSQVDIQLLRVQLEIASDQRSQPGNKILFSTDLQNWLRSWLRLLFCHFRLLDLDGFRR